MTDAPEKPAQHPAQHPARRWPIRTVLVPQVTNIQAEAYRFAPVSLPREPWEKTQ